MIRLVTMCALVLLLSLGCEAAENLGIGEPTAVEYQEREAALRAKSAEVEPTINDARMWQPCDTLREDFGKRAQVLDAALSTALVRSDGLRNLGEAYGILGEQIELMEEVGRDLGACVQRLEDKSSWASSDFPETFDFLFARNNHARVERQVEIINEVADIQQDVVRELMFRKASGIDVPEACNEAYDEWHARQLELVREGSLAALAGETTVGLLARYESALAILSHLEKSELDIVKCDQ